MMVNAPRNLVLLTHFCSSPFAQPISRIAFATLSAQLVSYLDENTQSNRNLIPTIISCSGAYSPLCPSNYRSSSERFTSTSLPLVVR